VKVVFCLDFIGNQSWFRPLQLHNCLGGAVIRHLTCDRKVAGSTPSRGTSESTKSTQPYIPPA